MAEGDVTISLKAAGIVLTVLGGGFAVLKGLGLKIRGLTEGRVDRLEENQKAVTERVERIERKQEDHGNLLSKMDGKLDIIVKGKTA